MLFMFEMLAMSVLLTSIK